ncbi:MAG: hypothetical protein ACOC1K_02105 [Nanoarchaeota archaeon]
MSENQDFNPIIPEDEEFVKELENFKSGKIDSKNNNLILNDKKSLSVLNLVNIASTHIQDLEECRQDIKEATKRLNKDMYKMSVKELIEFTKIKIREMEIHAKSLRDIYTISMRTELAKQFLLEGIKNERTIKNITPKVNNLINALQKEIST